MRNKFYSRPKAIFIRNEKNNNKSLWFKASQTLKSKRGQSCAFHSLPLSRPSPVPFPPALARSSGCMFTYLRTLSFSISFMLLRALFWIFVSFALIISSAPSAVRWILNTKNPSKSTKIRVFTPQMRCRKFYRILFWINTNHTLKISRMLPFSFIASAQKIFGFVGMCWMKPK